MKLHITFSDGHGAGFKVSQTGSKVKALQLMDMLRAMIEATPPGQEPITTEPPLKCPMCGKDVVEEKKEG